MRSLFFKIFLWFCVIVVLVGVSLETSSILANYYETRWQMVLHSVMPMEAEKCARLYETSGKQAVQDYLDELQRQKSVRFYFFDEDGHSLLDRGEPEPVFGKSQAGHSDASGRRAQRPQIFSGIAAIADADYAGFRSGRHASLFTSVGHRLVWGGSLFSADA